MTDHYATLGIKATASLDEIRRAFRKLAAKYHPDRNPGDRSAELKFKSITKAYDVLSSAPTRAKYDQDRTRPAPPPFGQQEPDFMRKFRRHNYGDPRDHPVTGDGRPHAPSEPMELGKIYRVSPNVKLGPIGVNEIPAWMASARVFRKKS